MSQAYKQLYLTNDLSTYDPYDIWKTNIGIKVKNMFNTSRILGAMPALILSVYDVLFNNSLRLGYKKQEYPIVRALAAQILLKEYNSTKNPDTIRAAEVHLEWLKTNVSKGYSGACWGLGFRWSAFKNVIYDANTPHSTHTPYVLEAFHLYTIYTGNHQYVDLIKSCFSFYEKDLHVLYEDDSMMTVSYGPIKDKIVINVASYTLFVYTIFLSYFPERNQYILQKINKLYQFIRFNQNENGSWFYSKPEKESFIDSFHSCFILKNLMKAGDLVPLDNMETVVKNGYKYLTDSFIDEKHGLYKRFTVSNKLSLTKFDLYDNAEILNIMKMLGDKTKAKKLNEAISRNFINGDGIYSVIDFLGVKRNKNTLRWAVMPYLSALAGSEM